MVIEIIEIKFKDIEIHLPESSEAVALARKLLDLFQETLEDIEVGSKQKPIPEKPHHADRVETGSRIVTDESKRITSLLDNDGYKFQECEKFDHSNLSAHKAGKSTYWLSNDAKRVCIEREGYAQGLYVYAAIEDLKYLQDNPDKVLRTLKKFIRHKRYHVTGFLKDVDVSTLSSQEVPQEPNEQEHNEPKEKQDDKPKIKFFQEDTGFDYMAVQPKWVGRTQVYSNSNGKMVIKADREIVLTTKDTIEKLLQYDEKDLNSCIRGISPQKQNVLRIYLKGIKGNQ